MKFIYGLVCIFLVMHIQAAVVVRGNGSKEDSYAFTVPVAAAHFNQTVGIFLVGLETPTVDDTGDFALSLAHSPQFSITPAFVPIAQDALLQSQGISYIHSAVNSGGDLLAGVVTQTNDTRIDNPTIVVTSLDGSNVASLAFNDTNGDTSSGIVSVVGAPTRFFAAVRGTDGGNPQDFGIGTSGIASVMIDNNPDSLVLRSVDLAAGIVNQNKAAALNQADILISGDSATTMLGGALANRVPLYWDELLQVLYIGLSVQTNADTYLRGVVKGNITPDVITQQAQLLMQPIVNDAAISGSEIVVNRGTGQAVSVQFMSVMHASTGPSYLIVNGGSDSAAGIAGVGINVYAMPLVNDETNPAHGTLANKNALLIDGAFVTPAINPGELVSLTDIPALVGGGPLLANSIVTDFQVLQDTVYISIKDQTTNTGGILFSQAQFGADGKIICWTPWAQHAAPFQAFEVLPDSQVQDTGIARFFAVDSESGLVWIVESITGRLVGITSWADTFRISTLPHRLKTSLGNGCYSVYDMHKGMIGLGPNNNRYALFGGVSRVAIARTSSGTADLPVTDFSDDDNFLLTLLPSGAGAVTSVLWAPSNNVQDRSFLLAGTENGLFVYAQQNGEGLVSSTLGLLNDGSFDGSWFGVEILELQQPIIAMTRLTDHVYVLTQNFEENVALYSLYRINMSLDVTVDTVFSESNVFLLAESDVEEFESIFSFYDCVVTNTDDPAIPTPLKEQVILATNQGLFFSTADQAVAARGAAQATNQEQMNWQEFGLGSSDIFNGIGRPDTTSLHTVWPFNLFRASCRKSLQAEINQVSMQGTGALFDMPQIGTFDPEFFNANADSPNASVFAAFDPITYFWSDGARRFFIFNAINAVPSKTILAVIPYDIDLVQLQQLTTLAHPIVQKTSRFFWVRPIGAQGIIMAGTDKGVIALL